MTRFLIPLLLSGLAAAQMAMPAPGPTADAAPPPAPVARMYAVYAHGAVPQQPYMDETLKSIAPLLGKLPFTSYEAISILDKEMPWGESTLFPINAVYSLHVTPMSLDEQGLIALRANIDMLHDGAYVSALDTHAQAANNQALLFRGMPLHGGELVVVLFVGMPPDDQPGDGQSEPEEQEQQEQEQETGEEQDIEEQDVEEQPADEEEAPEALENLEALLESLEDIDKREQVEERNQRTRIDFKGDWW